MGSPVWSRDGIIAVGNAFKGRVNLTFAYGASLPDPDKLFNAGFEGNARRVINIFENDEINERALKTLVRAAIKYNQTNLKKNQKKKRPRLLGRKRPAFELSRSRLVERVFEKVLNDLLFCNGELRCFQSQVRRLLTRCS